MEKIEQLQIELWNKIEKFAYVNAKIAIHPRKNYISVINGAREFFSSFIRRYSKNIISVIEGQKSVSQTVFLENRFKRYF